ncbi:hypothetical protein [Pseudomonas syringae]|uniref:hypothetical protein n=1 Tax=Pseudomonas syringae TaxID=317 RepID=UPI001F47500E|nr:hypothetical protein [Pseudomonas syringae]MCF5371308.1 hypothetical protein [Pseudomonas syringae]MCF5382095.1 hypothetical protein [Pseudomonas syringae]MCF5422924.1 hypothetical protein [Pseudomonas syringae]MCF5455488.1 hypothetical protein [Pseudomonas syringae]MCF5460126.1 hypothetical protein [Pseudomonas syringae]
MAFFEYGKCALHAERQVQQRRLAESESCFKRGSALIASMLAEGDLIDKALEPLKLDHLAKMEYVAKNSVYIKSQDGHEAIQIVWASNEAICIHRLLSKEFRKEFQDLWLGVWSEPLDSRSQGNLVTAFQRKVEYRERLRNEVGVNCEIKFAASPAVIMPKYEIRQ